MKIIELKTKIDNMEKQLLAISSLNDICQKTLYSNENELENFQSCAELLNHLVDPVMFEIEEIRLAVNAMCDGLKLVTIDGEVLCS